MKSLTFVNEPLSFQKQFLKNVITQRPAIGSLKICSRLLRLHYEERFAKGGANLLIILH